MTAILIIDDDRSELAALAEMVREWGYEPRVARTMEEGRERLAEADSDIHAVLLDWRLPDGDGVDLLGWIKEQPIGEELEVIIQSTTVVPGEIRRGIRQGAYYFLTKPYSGPQLLALLRAAISSRELKRKLRRTAAEVHDCFGLLEEGRFEVRTIGEAELLAAHLGSAAGDPQSGIGMLELLINGIEHGNLRITYEEKSRLLAEGTYEQRIDDLLGSAEHREKRVSVEFRRNLSHLELTITDHGDGFDYRRYLEFDRERFFDAHGRGVLLARAALELEYLEPGNRVRVRLPLAASSAPSADAGAAPAGDPDAPSPEAG